MNINLQNYKYLCDLVRKKTGISLSEEKMYLVDARLLPIARKENYENIDKLVEEIQRNPSSKLLTEILEAMTTNETSFFRDIKPFDQLKEFVFPHVSKHQPAKDIKVWSAACSSGQEAYSIIMTAEENKHTLNNKGVKITATDINTKIIERAKEGLYTQFELQRGLPITYLMKYFTQLESYGDKWQINDSVKSKIDFKYLNLLDNFGSIGRFDIIFCRNVLIYFEREMKIKILEKLARCLEPQGILILGSSETVNHLSNDLEVFDGQRGLFCLKK